MEPCRSPIDRQPAAALLPSKLYHYVVVRSDLPIGLLAAQVVHAAGESADGPVLSGTHAVVLGASPRELAGLQARLLAAEIPHTAIVENDAPYTDQLMAIGFPPSPRAVVYPYVKRFALLGEVKT